MFVLNIWMDLLWLMYIVTVLFGSAGEIAPEIVRGRVFSVRFELSEDSVMDMDEGSKGVSRLDEIWPGDVF